jgi:CBS domain containing-hemolysin-like protein
MEDASRPWKMEWINTLRIGSHTFAATLLLTALAAAVSVWLLPLLAFALGSGWVAPLLTALLLFNFLLFFRRTIFKNIYRDAPGDVDAAILEYLVQQGPAHHSEEEEELTVGLLENALHLKEVRAHDCMAPRPEIIHIDVHATVEELRRIFIESKLSRILVTDRDLDRVLGYVHVQQLFAHPRSLRSIVLPINFVPESIPISDLLNKFIRTRSSITCVVDEYGSVAGLVTLEDALEQLFGEIDDEHDQEEFIDVCVSPTEYIFSGRLEIDYLNKRYPILHLPTGDYTTLSGYLVTAAQTIPEQGVRLELDHKTFLLELVSDRKIETVRVLL